jgi:hypothetical protein
MRIYYDIDPNDVGGGAIAPLSRTANPITAAAPTTVKPIPLTVPTKPPVNPNLIPQPNYKDQASRSAYLKQWAAKYGDLEGRGDTIMKLNEVPRTGSDTTKNIMVKAASNYGLDPALLHASAMEEGASGLYKDLSGKDTKGRKPGDFGYQDYFGDKDFPVNGGQSFGLATFDQRFPDLVKGGYLPKEFASKFRGKNGEFGANDFKDADSAIQAKAAMMKYHYDDTDSYAAHRGIKLSPKARDFFAMAEFNGGEGLGHSMMNDYHNNGYLEGDKFLQARPTKGKGLTEASYGPKILDGKVVDEGAYAHIARRLKMRDNLKEQHLFE